MSKFVKYQHVEKFGTTETDNIEVGTCYVFPKIDGTNSSLWLGDDGEIKCGSRNRELTIDDDNAGFCKWAEEQAEVFTPFFEKHPDLRLFGEFLVPHTLKSYRDSAWRRFYVFDVVREYKYINYEEYQPLMEEFGIEYIPPLRIVNNGSYETFIDLLEKNDYLIEDGRGVGEGIVIKNYLYENKYGRQTWAKIVRTEFKEKAHKTHGAPMVDGKRLDEDAIVEDFCTDEMIKKVYANIKSEKDGWSTKYIAELLGRVWHDLITEECWNFVKKLRNPKVDFKTLQCKVIIKIKETLPEVF